MVNGVCHHTERIFFSRAFTTQDPTQDHMWPAGHGPSWPAQTDRWSQHYRVVHASTLCWAERRVCLYCYVCAVDTQHLSRFAFLMTAFTATTTDLRSTGVVRFCRARWHQEVAGGRDQAWPRVHAGMPRRRRRRGMTRYMYDIYEHFHS